MKILGMGNALVDVLVKINDDKVLDDMQLPKGSMQLIDSQKLITINEEINKLDKTIVSGGSAANTIVGLARLGVDTGFLGRIGKDKFGEYYKNDLENNNVKSHLTEVDEVSGIASTFISQDGQRTFGTYLGAAALLDAKDLKREDFADYDYFYIEGYLVQSHELIEQAIVMAKESGAKIILDLASYNIVEENKDFLTRIIPKYVDIIFANEEEAFSFHGLSAEKVVSILAKDTDIAIVKTGSKGSWIQQGNDKFFIEAHSVNCVDTTGAGDLYAAGFLFGLTKNLPLKECGEIGTLLAANVIQVVGAKIEDDKWKEITDTISL